MSNSHLIWGRVDARHRYRRLVFANEPIEPRRPTLSVRHRLRLKGWAIDDYQSSVIDTNHQGVECKSCVRSADTSGSGASARTGSVLFRQAPGARRARRRIQGTVGDVVPPTRAGSAEVPSARW